MLSCPAWPQKDRGIFCIDEMDDSFLIARKRGFLRAVRQMQLDQEESLIGQIHGDYEKAV